MKGMEMKFTPFSHRGARVALALGVAAGTAWTATSVEAAELRIDFPKPFTLIQRDAAAQGVIRVRGAFPPDKAPEKIEVRFDGGEWRLLTAQVESNAFAGSFAAPVGQGLLELRGVGGAGDGLKGSVACVGVGDLFLVAGQSNADGRGRESVLLSPSNPFVGVKFLHNAWSKGDDPSANDTTPKTGIANAESGSPWPNVLNRLIPDQNVPMGFIAAAVGSTVVKQWRSAEGATVEKAWSPGGMYARAREMVRTATDGGMKIRAVLYHQGENDLGHHNGLSVLGNEKEYKENLMAAVTDFWKDYQAPVLVGQITNLGGDRERNDSIRRAQRQVWDEHPHALPGAVTYDIFPTDGVHYREPANMKAYSDRWTAAILHGLYGHREMASPKSLGVRRDGERRIALDYDQPLVRKSWDGREGAKAEGLRLVSEGRVFDDMQVVSTELQGGTAIFVFNRSLPATPFQVCYGSGSDGQGRVVLRSAGNGLPVPMIFELTVE